MLKAYPRVWVDLTTGEVLASLLALLNPGRACGDTMLQRFEKEFAALIGTTGAVSFPNCRSALYHSLRALDFEPGSEIILPAFTFWIDVAVTVLASYVPVFVDVEFDTLNIDAKLIESAVTPNTRAILLTHLNGLSADMDGAMAVAEKHRLRLIEDSARTCGGRYKGRRVGSFDIGAFSFGYGKSFYGFGGGMVTSDDTAFLGRLRELRNSFSTITPARLVHAVSRGCLLKFLNTPSLHGLTLFPFAKRYMRGDLRFNSWFKIQKPNLTTVPDTFTVKMFNSQAARGFRQIRTIDRSNEIRRRHMKTLNRELSDIPGLQLPPDPDDREHVCVHYVVWTERKKALQDYLLDCRIDAQDESAEDVTQMKRFASYVGGAFPNAAKLHDRLIYIPCHPCLTDDDIRYIAGKIRAFFQQQSDAPDA